MITISSGGAVPRVWNSKITSNNLPKRYTYHETYEGLSGYISSRYGFIIGPWELSKWTD